MADSNGAWGELAAHSDELAAELDLADFLPEPGVSEPLDSFIERRNLTINALRRLGARLADHTVLVFPFPGGLRYRDLVTDKRWTSAEAEWSKLKIVHANPREDAAICIVSEGESDGARLVMLYPDVDVAICPGSGSMASRYGLGYAEQLAGYKQVLAAFDPDRDGDAGYALLSEHLADVQRWNAPGGGDWCEHAGDAPLLPTPREVVRAGGLVFEDLRSMLDGSLEPPAMMIDDLLYTEGVHFLSGHPESGKTTLAMHAAWTAMGDGRHVVWLDYEGGLRATVQRLVDVGIPAELLIERFHYAGWPVDAPKYFGDVAELWAGAFIVIDSASKSLTLAGLDENSPSDVTRWIAPIVKACKDHRLPVVVIDHVTKNASATTRYSRGAGSKLADTDVAWYVEAVEPFNRERAGLMHCHQQKDRGGYLPFDLWYTVGDGHGGLEIVPTTAPVDDQPLPTSGSDSPTI